MSKIADTVAAMACSSTLLRSCRSSPGTLRSNLAETAAGQASSELRHVARCWENCYQGLSDNIMGIMGISSEEI